MLCTFVSPSYSNPNFEKESNFLNNLEYLNQKNNSTTYTPKDKTDKYIIKTVNYARKFVPLMNDGLEGSKYTDLMFNDGKNY